jgi:hypothetical protein
MARAVVRRLDAVGDRLLGLLLPTYDAGACVPEHGQYCGCSKHCRRKIISCTGSCVETTVSCC